MGFTWSAEDAISKNQVFHPNREQPSNGFKGVFYTAFLLHEMVGLFETGHGNDGFQSWFKESLNPREIRVPNLAPRTTPLSQLPTCGPM
jgi:hypothetical protein